MSIYSNTISVLSNYCPQMMLNRGQGDTMLW